MRITSASLSATRRTGLPILCLFAICLLIAVALSPGQTAPMTTAQAQLVVRHWLALDPVPLGTALPRQIAGVTPYGSTATPLYYAVALSPGGFVLVPGDDRLEPVIAFAPHGVYDPSENTPLGALVQRDLPQRLAWASAARTGKAAQEVTRAQSQWAALLASDVAGQSPKSAAVSDPRVDPLILSTWSQQTANEDGVTACYNYFTPPNAPGKANNYPCGCVATAMAQLMRYWQYPTTGVGSTTFPITVNGGASTGKLRGGDGNGGPYQWDDMPLSPTTGTATADCQAIGALCADAGVSVQMDYESSEASAYDNLVAPALTSVFDFGNAIYAYDNEANLSSNLPGIINPDLDAGFPVILGIYGVTGYAHELVCDGYGYQYLTMYYHLNLGWSGMDTAWYNLPYIGTDYGFNVVDTCTYNVFPTGSGEVISGRVLTETGVPVSDATVTATGNGQSYPAVTTNARGIYAVAQVPSATSYTLTATGAGLPTTSITVTTDTSTTNTMTTGNVWPADIIMGAPAPILLLQKSCAVNYAVPGEQMTYYLTYENGGSSTATNVQLTDALPNTVSYVANSASNGGSYASSAVSWSIPSLAPGQTGSVTFRVLVPQNTSLGTVISNTAAISSTEISTPINSNTLNLTTVAAQRGDCWMFGHDAQHTGRSPFTGPATHTLRWKCAIGYALYTSPAIGADGTIYLGSSTYPEGYNLYAINPDGTQQWAFPTGNGITSSPAIGPDGTIYFGSDDRKLYAVNPDGTQKWAFTTGFNVVSSPAIGTDGTIYVGSEDDKLYAVNADGTQKWAFPTGRSGGGIQSSPAIGTDGTIYVGSCDDNLYAINPDGTEQWAFPTGNCIYSSPAIGADGTIYVGSWDYNLYAMNPDGTQQWAFPTGSYITSSPAIGADGTIYLGCEDTDLYAVNPDGTQKWVLLTSNWGSSMPTIGADGTIYLGSYDHNLHAINSYGTQIWTYATNGAVRSSPAIGADGTLYFGSTDGNLYAIGSQLPPTRALPPSHRATEEQALWSPSPAPTLPGPPRWPSAARQRPPSPWSATPRSAPQSAAAPPAPSA